MTRLSPILLLLTGCYVSDAQLEAALDRDGDGFRTMAVTGGTDCDDSDASVHPGAPEVCGDGVDNDCDGLIGDMERGEGERLFYPDPDRDGWGSNSGEPVWACGAPEGYVDRTGDCAPFNPIRNPSAEDYCNGIDDDCDGVIDEDAEANLWFADRDGDQWGDDHDYVLTCQVLDGTHVVNGGDCDDNDDQVTRRVWYADLDGDGFGGLTPIEQCQRPVGHVDISGDCDDANVLVNPGQLEICGNGIDDDCDANPGLCSFDEYALAEQPDPSLGSIVDVADVDADGFDDALLWQSGALRTTRGTGRSSFDPNRTDAVTVLPIASYTAQPVVLGDVDDDGVVDAVLAADHDALLLAGPALLLGGEAADLAELDVHGSISGVSAVTPWPADPCSTAPGLVASGSGIRGFTTALGTRQDWGSYRFDLYLHATDLDVDDFDGDGCGDLVVGLIEDFDAAGALRVYLAPLDGQAAEDAALDLAPHPEQSAFALPSKVSDLDADGIPDVLTSASGTPLPEGYGTAELYSGNGTTLDPTPTARFYGAPGAYMVASPLGDLDGDGHADVVLHTSRVPYTTVYLMAGPFHGDYSVADASQVLPQPTTQHAFGASVSSGDIDADGRTDLVVGAPAYTETASGRTYVYWGSGY